MKMHEAVEAICGKLGEDALVVSANGSISRELYAAMPRGGNFYMLGSMGQASSIALGVALAQPEKKVVVLDGDGNLLMNMGILATAKMTRARNFYHVVLDNGAYNTTGGQPTAAAKVGLAPVAKACGYRMAVEAKTPGKLKKSIKRMLGLKGPAMVVAKVTKEKNEKLVRIPLTPPQIKRRFRKEALSKTKKKVIK